MCRSIKLLNEPGQTATPEELSGAALQFVRKISGFRKPSRANEEAFQRAVLEIAESSKRLLAATKRKESARKSEPAVDGSDGPGSEQADTISAPDLPECR